MHQKTLHNAIKEDGDEGQACTRKAKVWEALDKIFLYCKKIKWARVDLEEYKQTLNSFKKSMIDAWIDHQITHYMVRL